MQVNNIDLSQSHWPIIVSLCRVAEPEKVYSGKPKPNRQYSIIDVYQSIGFRIAWLDDCAEHPGSSGSFFILTVLVKPVSPVIFFICVNSQPTMNTFANRQEGWAISMVGIVTTGTLDDSRQADSETKQPDPYNKQRTHGTARSPHLKSQEHCWHVNQNGCPQNPASLADFRQTLVKG